MPLSSSTRRDYTKRRTPNSARLLWICTACCGLPAFAQDARDIVRKSVELDQINWLRMADYTWIARSRERHLDAQNRVTSEHEEGWETIILGGEPYRRMLERDEKPLPTDQQKKEQEKLDKTAARIEKETPEQKQRRLAEYAKQRRRDREFLRRFPTPMTCAGSRTKRSMARTCGSSPALPSPGITRRAAMGARY